LGHESHHRSSSGGGCLERERPTLLAVDLMNSTRSNHSSGHRGELGPPAQVAAERLTHSPSHESPRAILQGRDTDANGRARFRRYGGLALSGMLTAHLRR
jgi:hypothetical protein